MPTPMTSAPRGVADGPECVVALDVGGTCMKGALLDRALRPLHTVRRATPRRSGPEAVVEEIAAVLRALDGHAAGRTRAVRGAGVVVPGIVDEETRTAVHSVNLGWRDLPLGALLEEATGLHVALGHDVRAGGAAEGRLGAARGVRDAWFVPVGTGIAAALLCDGRALRAGGYAGELGHVVVDPGGAPCACGGRGCLEGVASAAAVAAAYEARTGRATGGAAEVAAAVVAGDPDARVVWDRAVEALASALATAATLLAPEVVVVGGGLAESGGLLLDPLRAALARRLSFQRRPRVVRAALGDRAGCLGAGLAAWDAADGAASATPVGTTTPRTDDTPASLYSQAAS
ncbi:ROK family protein [Streptomyces sp. NPDC059491]|uniref:ROK family protein n=1 Tax=Streptomyces sp. NPDC059491 TaxID=3346850 RepID=UPI0036BC167B